MDSPTSSVSSISPVPIEQITINNDKPIELLIDLWKDEKCMLPYEVPSLLSYIRNECNISYDVQYILENVPKQNTIRNGLRILKYLYKKYNKNIQSSSELLKNIQIKLNIGKYKNSNIDNIISENNSDTDIYNFNIEDNTLNTYIYEDFEYQLEMSFKYKRKFDDNYSEEYD